MRYPHVHINSRHNENTAHQFAKPRERSDTLFESIFGKASFNKYKPFHRFVCRQIGIVADRWDIYMSNAERCEREFFRYDRTSIVRDIAHHPSLRLSEKITQLELESSLIKGLDDNAVAIAVRKYIEHYELASVFQLYIAIMIDAAKRAGFRAEETSPEYYAKYHYPIEKDRRQADSLILRCRNAVAKAQQPINTILSRE